MNPKCPALRILLAPVVLGLHRAREHVVYVLHAFQKKSKSGIVIPKKEIDLIYRRMEPAERDHEKENRK